SWDSSADPRVVFSLASEVRKPPAALCCKPEATPLQLSGTVVSSTRLWL
ncbi:hypothetical protein GBF38_017375, partial [Nibea albiflora]